MEEDIMFHVYDKWDDEMNREEVITWSISIGSTTPYDRYDQIDKNCKFIDEHVQIPKPTPYRIDVMGCLVDVNYCSAGKTQS
jgi:hypothetical protein